MDLTTGLLKSNEAITGADPTGKFISGVNAGQVARSNATSNEKSRLELDNQEKLQKAISMSVDENHNLVPDLLLKNGHDLGIDQQVLDHAVKYLPAQWDSIKKTAQSKMGIAAINPEESTQLDKGVQNQAGASQAPAASQSWANQPARTRQPEQVQGTTEGSQTFTLPPMEGDSAGTTSANGDITGGKVSVNGQYNEDGTPVNPNKSIFQIANEAPASTQMGVENTPISNPVMIAELSPEIQGKVMTAMQQSGLLKAGATIADAQKQADIDLSQIMQKAVVPTKNMFIDAEGNFDIGAYNKALAEYPAKKAALLDEVKKKYGAYYGDQLAQKMTLEGNSRANVAQATQQGSLQAEAQSFEDKANNINTQLGTDFKPLSPLALQKGSPAQIDALTNGAKAYATLMELDAKVKAEKRKPTLSEVAGATNQMMLLDGMGSNMSNEEKIQNLLNSGLISRSKAMLLGNTPVKEMAESIAKAYASTKMGKNESIKDMAKATSYSKLHAQFEGNAKAFSGANWKNQPAGSTKGTKDNPIPYVKGMTTTKGKFYLVPGHGVIEGVR